MRHLSENQNSKNHISSDARSFFYTALLCSILSLTHADLSAQTTTTTKTQTNKQFGAWLEQTTMNKDEMETFMSKEGIYNGESKADILDFWPKLDNYQLKIVYDIFNRSHNTYTRKIVLCYYIRRDIDTSNPKKYKRVEKTVNKLSPEDKKWCNEQVDASMRLAMLYSLKP